MNTHAIPSQSEEIAIATAPHATASRAPAPASPPAPTPPLHRLSDDALVAQTRHLAREELRIGLDVLAHLREVEARRLHLSRGHPSLFAFCLRELGYSEPQAQLRIDAMRALRDTPAIEAPLREGRIAVTAVVKAQQFFRREEARTGRPVAAATKREILIGLQQKSTREVERALLAISPEAAIPPERERVIAPELTELRLVIPETLRAKLETLKARHSHRLRDAGSWVALLELLADDALAVETKRRPAPDRNVAPIAPKVAEAVLAPSATEAAPSVRVASNPSRFIPAAIRREIWRRDQGRCTYRDPRSGVACGSEHYVQIDHRVPISCGGTGRDAGNLRLLCGAHNRLAWREWKASGSRETHGIE